TVYHVSRLQANLTFSIVLLALGITAGFGGYLNNRFGPRIVATAGGILYGLGVLLAAFAAPNIFILYLTFGIIGGIGIGLGYIVALAMLIKWFPDRRGFITGLAVAGFGAGALITSPVAAALITSVGLGSTFLYLGIAYLVVIGIFNGAWRLFSGWLSDGIGRPFTFLSMFIIQAIVFAILPSITSFALLLVPAAIIALCYGGGFGTMPAFAADFFGAKNAGPIYG